MSQKAFCAIHPRVLHGASHTVVPTSMRVVYICLCSLDWCILFSILKGFLLLLDLYLPQRQQTDRETLTDKQINKMKQRRE